ncbi:MAG: hypothetical protein K6C94_04620 [Candidatus Gastranaerophilales bacterium]|nr:hypothetical protein [Candidatus Gastranaerophilales bacterium]
MIKKKIEYTFFTILNIYLSAFWLNAFVTVFIVVVPIFKIAIIIEKYNHVENFADNVFIYSLIFVIPIFSMLLKILIFPFLYKIKFLSNIKDFLKKFATDKNFSIKILFSALIFDIIVYLITVFLLEKQLVNPDYIDAIKESALVFVFTFFGVLPCYLSFLIWYKWTHRKSQKSVG